MANAALNKLKSKVKTKTLVGKQKNLDVNKNGKLDKEDFKILRGNKMAKGGETKEFIDWNKIIGKKINGWKAEDNNGISILWENDNSEYSFYATPGWENEKKLPIQIVGDGGDFGIAMFSKNEDASYQLNDYLMEVKEIIRIINSKKTLSVSDFKNSFSKVINNGDSFKKGGYMADGGMSGKYDKKKLLKEIEEYDALIITNKDGDKFIIYNPDSGNDENTAIWKSDDYIIGTIPDDGREVKVKYSDIVKVSDENNDDYADGGKTYDKALFKKELAEFKKDICGEGGECWISPTYVLDSWELSGFKTDVSNVNSLAAQDLYKDLIDSKLLYHEEMGTGEKGEKIESFRELYGWNYGENLEYAKGGKTKENKSFILVAKDITIKADNVKDFIKKANANDYTLMQVYNQNDEEVKSKNPIFNFSWMIGLPRFKELVGPMKDGPNQFRYEDEWVNERMSVEKGGYMADGGELAKPTHYIEIEGYNIEDKTFKSKLKRYNLKMEILEEDKTTSGFKSPALVRLTGTEANIMKILKDKNGGWDLDLDEYNEMKENGDGIKLLNSTMADGGVIAQENNEMLQSNMKEIRHHSDELKNIVTDSTEVEPWVIAKTERASTDLSDVTHYLDGEKDRSLKMPFEKGGYMAEGGFNSDETPYTGTTNKTIEYLRNAGLGEEKITKNLIRELLYKRLTESLDLAHQLMPQNEEENLQMSSFTKENLRNGAESIWKAKSYFGGMAFEKGGYMEEGGEISSKVKDLQSNLSKEIRKSQNEIEVLGQYYKKDSTSLKSLSEAYFKLQNAVVDILFGTYDKDLKNMKEVGYMANGGKIENQYENLTPKEIWSMWSETQRGHFLRDHKHEFPEIQDSIFVLRKKDFGKLPARIQIAIEYHVEDGQYAMGGKLNRETYERMSELTTITAKKELTTAAKSIRHELKEEGFENDEVDSYLCHIVTNSYEDGGMMAKGGMSAKDRKIADHIVKTYNMDEPGMAPVYANQLRREESRLNKTYGRDWQKTMSPADKANRFLEAVRVADNDIKLKDITVEASPRGNWVVFEHGKVIMTVNQDMLDEETIRTYNLEHHNK
jgi:hypothetical protein